MREMFVGSGLFSWKSVTANASRGDIYLDESTHTAMALGGGRIGHFTGSEAGGNARFARYGAPGDQTGRESRIQDWCRGSWDGVLCHNGKADGSAAGGSGSGAPSGDVPGLAARAVAGEFGNGASSARQTPQCGVCSEKARALSERAYGWATSTARCRSA